MIIPIWSSKKHKNSLWLQMPEAETLREALRMPWACFRNHCVHLFLWGQAGRVLRGLWGLSSIVQMEDNQLLGIWTLPCFPLFFIFALSFYVPSRVKLWTDQVLHSFFLIINLIFRFCYYSQILLYLLKKHQGLPPVFVLEYPSARYPSLRLGKSHFP